MVLLGRSPEFDAHTAEQESAMKVMTSAILAFSITVAASPMNAESVPDALSVEWKGAHPCEKLFEDAQVRVARCTFPPGAVHVCHSHPSYLSYVVSGGRGQIQDEKGVRKVEIVTGALVDAQPIPWHEFTNLGDTTIQFVVVEKKYQAGPMVDQSSCPKSPGMRAEE
jgi:quercetin dioxygenase-like cupin family protein